MIEELFNSTCSIYRLTGYENYNTSTSVEGEVTESWVLVASLVPCRIDRARTPTERRDDGMVETGTTLAFFKVTQNIKDGDRISVNSKRYHVVDAYPVAGFDEDHHIEAEIKLIDALA
jgi:hypothetical protein